MEIDIQTTRRNTKRHKALEVEPSITDRAFPSCDALTLQAPHIVDALQAFVQQSLPLLPPGISLASLNRVLDVGCGRHLWGRDLYRAMLEQAGPELIADVRIEGIDLCPEVVQTARNAIRTGRGQVLVSQENLLQVPAERTACYQLVQMRFLSLSLPASAWPLALTQLRRVYAPGGTVAWLEPSLPTPGEKTPGWNQWLYWIEQALTFHGGSHLLGTTMNWLFQQAGPWTRLQRHCLAVPLLAATRDQGFLTHERVQVLQGWLEELRPWLVGAGIAAEQVDAGLKTVLDELCRRVISSVWPWTMIAGTLSPERTEIMDKRHHATQ